MEGDDRISDDALARTDEETSTQSESDYSEQDVGYFGVSKRVERMEHSVSGFRIATSGIGFLRGRFGKLQDNVTDLKQRIDNLNTAIDEFHLEGDDLNVSGSFNKGYTVSRENPCQQEQDNPNPT